MYYIGCLSLSGCNILLLGWSPGGSFASPHLTFVTSAAQCRFWHRVGCCVLLRGARFWSLGPFSYYAAKAVGPSSWNDLPVELRCLLISCPFKFYIFLKFFFFGRDWAGSASEY